MDTDIYTKLPTIFRQDLHNDYGHPRGKREMAPDVTELKCNAQNNKVGRNDPKYNLLTPF